jgi:uncharacterized membrane protein
MEKTVGHANNCQQETYFAENACKKSKTSHQFQAYLVSGSSLIELILWLIALLSILMFTFKVHTTIEKQNIKVLKNTQKYWLKLERRYAN